MKVVQKFRFSPVTACVWVSENESGDEVYTITLRKVYKDKLGDWKETTSFKVEDLPRAMVAMGNAYEFIAMNNGDEVEE